MASESISPQEEKNVLNFPESISMNKRHSKKDPAQFYREATPEKMFKQPVQEQKKPVAQTKASSALKMKKHKLIMPTKKKFINAEYVWLGGTNAVDMRSKTRTIQQGKVPGLWNYDGSSTGQVPGDDSEVIIRPIRVYLDPFRNEGDILVLCETIKNGKPTKDNTRAMAEPIFQETLDEEPMFGIEQEYFVVDNSTGKALCWPESDLFVPKPQGEYYCGVSGNVIVKKLREYYEASLMNLRAAGIPLTGGNLEGAPGQLEIQVCDIGIAAPDHLWMSRFILQRTAQHFGFGIELKPKPYFGDWSGSGAHVNFSTKKMRDDGGFPHIMEAIKNLEAVHMKHINCYGLGNKQRLTGKNETASWEQFSYGVGNRGTSVRIPVETNEKKKGYLEDRRPSSAMDPYVVCAMLVQTSLQVCPEIEFPEDLE